MLCKVGQHTPHEMGRPIKSGLHRFKSYHLSTKHIAIMGGYTGQNCPLSVMLNG